MALRVDKLNNGKYEVRGEYYDRDGKRHGIKRRFDKKKDADKFIEGHKADDAPSKDAKFSAWIDDWFAVYQVTAKLELTTIVAYERIIERLKNHFGAMPIRAIKPTDIDMLYLRLMDPAGEKVQEYEERYGLKPLTVKPLSSSTAQRHHAVLHRALAFAVRDDLVRSNAADKVDRPQSSAKEIVPPDLGAIQAALDALRGRVQYVPTCIALFAGLRQSEVLGLKWDCVDLAAKTLTVRRVRLRLAKKHLGKVRGDDRGEKIDIPGMECWVLRERLKGKHNRTLKIPDELVELLRNEQKRQRANRVKFGARYIASDFVCVHDDGMPVADGLSKALTDFRFHDLRHANASYLIDAGEPISEVSRRIGHNSTYTTAKTYIHAIKSQDERAAKSASRLYKI
jgi:integrase